MAAVVARGDVICYARVIRLILGRVISIMKEWLRFIAGKLGGDGWRGVPMLRLQIQGAPRAEESEKNHDLPV